MRFSNFGTLGHPRMEKVSRDPKIFSLNLYNKFGGFGSELQELINNHQGEIEIFSIFFYFGQQIKREVREYICVGVGVMKDYKLKLMDLLVSDTPSWVEFSF